jgi:hypothetical protein
MRIPVKSESHRIHDHNLLFHDSGSRVSIPTNNYLPVLLTLATTFILGFGPHNHIFIPSRILHPLK